MNVYFNPFVHIIFFNRLYYVYTVPFIGPTPVSVTRTDAPNCNCPDRIPMVKVVSPLLVTTDEFVVNPILTTV